MGDEPDTPRPKATALKPWETPESRAKAEEESKPYPLTSRIDVEEWESASAAPYCVVKGFYYEDVGVFVAPGGTGKTTLMLFEAIHIVLGLPLFGYEIVNPGPVVVITAEDSREMLIARLRHISWQMNLTEEQKICLRASIHITDVSGTGFKITEVVRDTVKPSRMLDRLIRGLVPLSPAIVFIDPAVSFGVGESRVNDAEQGLIDAARRIRNVVQCAVIYIHHTGKAAAKVGDTSQYAGRGGSAFADGARMVHVLQRLEPDAWLEATGYDLKPDESGLILARPKISATTPQPELCIVRRGYIFERCDHSAGASALLDANGRKVLALLREQVALGQYPSARSIEPHAREAKIRQKALRETIAHLIATGQVIETPTELGGRGGAKKYLRPVDASR